MQRIKSNCMKLVKNFINENIMYYILLIKFLNNYKNGLIFHDESLESYKLLIHIGNI